MARRIRTPLYQHWNHFRVGVLPFVCFAGCVVLTLWLWQRQGLRGTLVGEVESVTVEVASGADGILRIPPSKESYDADGNLIASSYWQRFDRVAKGDIIAVLDQSLLDAKLGTVNAEKEKLKAELEVTTQRVKLQIRALQQDYERNRVERISDYASAAVAYSEILVPIDEDTALYERIKQQYGFLKRSKDSRVGTVAESNLQDLINQAKVVKERLYANTRVRDARRQALEIAEKYKVEYKEMELQLPEVDVMLETIERAQEVQDALKREIEVQIDSLTIKAPMDGIISEIYYYPGSAVQAGVPIVQISKEDSSYIVSYWREKYQTRPKPGMTVGVRLPQPGSREYQCVISSIGPQVVEVPVHQLQDQNSKEWAIPVKLPITPAMAQEMARDGVSLRPGELVHVLYRNRR